MRHPATLRLVLVLTLSVAVGSLMGIRTVASPQTRAPLLRTDSISRVVRDRARSVVFLHTVSRRSGQAGPNRQGDQLPSGAATLEPIEEGLGSGVIIEVPGVILTNAHVVDQVDAIHVRTPNGDDEDATVIGMDRVLDLALLRAPNLTDLPATPLGDSDRVTVGDWVVAIGSPLGLHHTATAGIISAKARGLDDSGLEFLQTDTAINPGSSGGALLDLNGALVGITTAIISRAGENVGLNFAIPVNEVKKVLPRLRQGDVQRGWLGMKTLTLTRRGARALGVDAGLVIIALKGDGPAARAGIRVGDIVLGAEGPPPATARDVPRRVLDSVPGTTLTLSIWREQQQLAIAVTVGSWPAP